MRSFRGLLSTITAVVFLGCAADESVGPQVGSGAARDVGTGVDAAKNQEDVLPGAARAKAKVYCAESGGCLAAAFEFTDLSDPAYGPYTLFTTYFQNLQGTYPNGGPSTPMFLESFFFQFLSSSADWYYVDAPTMGLSYSAVGNVQEGLYNALYHDGPGNVGWGPNYDHWYSLYPGGIVGCNVWPGDPPYWFAFQTCPSQGLDGWVKIDFVLRRLTWPAPGVLSTPKRPPVRFDDFLFTFGGLFSGGPDCTIGGDQPGTCTESPYRQVMGTHWWK